MKAKIISEGTTTWLANGGRESIDGLAIDGQRIVQVGTFIRAEEITPFARKNKKTTITFSVSREHNSIEDCGNFILTHAAELPFQGTLHMISIAAGGAEYEKILPNATIISDRSRQMGQSSFHSYTFIGGQLTAP